MCEYSLRKVWSPLVFELGLLLTIIIRLKQKLNLPKIEPRPPCPPSIYNKMFTYLETMLSKPPAKVERPQNKALKDSLRLGRSKEQELRSASEHTGRPNNETERASPSLHRSPNTIEPGATLTKRKKGRPSGADEEAAHRDDRSPYSRDTTPKVHSQRQRKPHPTPVQARPNPKPRKLNGVSKQDLDQLRPWVAPTIRHLCFWLKTPAAVPHMLAGVTTILTQPLWLDDGTQKVPEKKDKVPALIIAVYFFVATRLSGKETTGQEYTRQKHEALALMENWEVGRRERGKVVEKDVDAWLKEINAKGWLQREWFQNIKYGGGLEKEEDEEDRLSQSGQDSDGGDQNGREKSSRKRKKHSADQETPVYGLGTMVRYFTKVGALPLIML